MITDIVSTTKRPPMIGSSRWVFVARADVYDVLTLEGSVAARNHFGATAPEQVRAAVKRARARLG